MVGHEVRFRPSAEADLMALYDYIAGTAGPRIAGGFLARIETACRGLKAFPERGTRRDDLAPGIRTLGFERRVTIVFRLEATTVEIVAIAYAGRDFEADFGNEQS
jgi:toxin ParE1/3/4